MRFTTNAETLRLVRPFASTEASRPILNGVCIESTGVIVATNGHRLLAVAPIDASEPPTADTIVRLPKAVPSWADTAVFDMPDGATDGTMGTVTYWGKKKTDVHPAVYVEGPYPHWRNVLPREVARNHPMPPVNGEYLSDFAACDQSGRGEVWIAPDVHIGRAMRVEVAGRPNYVGLLMPMRADAWPDIAPLPSVIERRPEPATV